MVAIPTNARTAIRVTVPDGTHVQPWTIEFKPSDPDLVRLYSVDGDPHLILVETTDREGSLTLTCHLGQHGSEPPAAGTIDLEVSQHALAIDGELPFDLRV